MKIKVTNINYSITDEDVLNHVGFLGAILELDELVNFSSTSYITIDKSIFDYFEPDEEILIAFVEIPDIVFSYRMEKEDYDCVYCAHTGFLSYDEVRENLIETLPTYMELNISDDLFETDEDLDELVINMVSDATNFLLDGIDYEKVEE